MKIHVLAIGISAIFASAQTDATEDQLRTIATVGAQNSTSGFVQFKEGLSQPCLYGTVFLGDMSQPVPKAMMAVLLSAQASGARVSITYDMSGSNFCTASKVQAHS